MTTTTDRSELLDALTEGISKLTTSDEWQRWRPADGVKAGGRGFLIDEARRRL